MTSTGTSDTTDMGATELTLVRHGRTVWHAENRYAGVSDVPLDDTGRAQAVDLGEWVREHPHDVVACSPVPRARQTAAPAAAALGVEVEVIDALREVDFGSAESHTMAELRELDPVAAAAFVADPVRNPFPGAEPPEVAADRVLGGLRDVAERHRGRSVLVVGHNTALRLALCAWLGIPLSHYRAVLPRLDNTAATRLRVPADPAVPPALLSLNVPTAVPGRTDRSVPDRSAPDPSAPDPSAADPSTTAPVVNAEARSRRTR